MEREYADLTTTDDLDETVCYSDTGNDSDSTTTADSLYFHEDSSDESDQNEQNQVWHLKKRYMLHVYM